MENEKVKYIIDIIKDMYIKDKLRLAKNMSQSSFLSIKYNKKEMYKYYDNKFREINEEYRTTLINFDQTKYFNINFTMAKLIEMTSEEQNQVALFLFNSINLKLNKTILHKVNIS